MESDNEENDLEIDPDDSLNKDSSEELNLPQLIKNFNETGCIQWLYIKKTISKSLKQYLFTNNEGFRGHSNRQVKNGIKS